VSVPDRPGRGRQAEARRNDRLVLDAARDVFAEQGFDAPVVAVARRAGVGMGSLYRRYGSKEELLQRLCVVAMEQAIEAAEEALRDADAWTGLARYVTACVGFGSGMLSPVAGTITTTREMWETARRSRALVLELVERAHASGSLRPDATALDVTMLIQHFSRRPLPGPHEAEDREARERLLAIALDGLRVGPATPLPGEAPSWHRLDSRWGTPPGE
jgi:AcrR family transcriptional regulator